MRKIVLRILAGFIAIGVLLIGVLAVALPRLINRDEFQMTLRERAAETLGTPVDWESLEIGLLPLRLTINAPVLVAASGDPEDARLAAESVDLRLALFPIFSGRVQVDSLVLHGVELVVTRTSEGFLFPVAEEAEGQDASDAIKPADPAPVDEAPEAAAFEVALRRIVILESRVIIRDRTLARPKEWRLEELEFEAETQAGSASESLAVKLAANVRSGATEVGRIESAGTVSLAGLYDLDVEIERLLIAEFQPYLPDTTVSGVMSGRIALVGAASSLSEIELDLHVDQLAVEPTGLHLAGGLSLQARQALGAPATFSATLDLDTGGQAKITGTLALEDDDSIQFDATLEHSDGGRLDIEGTSTREGVIDVRAEFESFDLVLARPFLPDPKIELAGLATGKARIIGEAASPESISLDVRVESGVLRTTDYLVEGPFFGTLNIRDPLSDRPRGQIELDLTAARLEYQGQFKKPPGMRAEMTTKFSSDQSGEIVFESRIKFRDINEILLQGAIRDSISVAVTISSLNLEHWSDVLPALEPYQLDGVIRFEGIGVELVEDSPGQFRGRIALENIGLSLPDAGRLRIRGAIVGEGSRIRTKGLSVLMGGMTIGINGNVEDPLNEARFELAVKSIGDAEANDFFSALTSNRDTVFGNLELAGEVEGVASSEADLYSSIEGEFKFSIGKEKGGRLRGVSILRTILDQMPLLGGAARLTRPIRGGRSVDDYFTEHFEIIEGDFEIGQGRVDAKTLRLAYEGYEVRLSGPIRLRDLTIDMTGEILLKEDLVSVLGGHADADRADREPIRIPLARVTNTLADPKIVLTKEALAALPKLIFQGTGLETLAVDVGRALGRFLGGDDR
jgi:hypothetical protein